ncbi:MAG TPA: DUF1330 domain-containing protein [Bryobacteraceae bacterium]|nr:DUF1330 domain-containing protein [Bryobacteraceae bacterium]
MPAYLLVNVEVKDSTAYERYKHEVPALIRRHGGEYLVRGGKCEVIEGNWQPQRLVLFRFPNLQSIHAFFNDPDYQPLKDLRQRAAHTQAIAMEGL